ncbi:MAG TPA: hypothetical protein VFR23_11785 [Jiangellaceae bacterium]|nr:hypothetical protein [Jiangellaceae bacterium]
MSRFTDGEQLNGSETQMNRSEDRAPPSGPNRARPMSGHQLIDDYLAERVRRLPADDVNELADGLEATFLVLAAAGVTPSVELPNKQCQSLSQARGRATVALA